MEAEEIRKRIEKISDSEKPENPKFSVKFMDRSIDPADKFYDYCNANWVRTHPIPEDKAYWGASMELVERNRYILGKLLEECALKDSNRLEETQVGTFYLSGMDTQRLNELQFDPVRPYIESVDKLQSIEEIIPLVSRMHESGVPALFSYYTWADEKNSSTYAYYLQQGGISLPNRDYYFQESFEKVRNDFRKHITNMFRLFGSSESEASAASEIVFKIEVRMAGSSRTPVELRDPEKNYNRFSIEKANSSMAPLDLKQYLRAIELPQVEHIVVRQPEFFGNLGKILAEVPLPEWKIYLKWKLLSSASPFLHKEAEEENFDFYHRKLFGQPKQEKRWKKIVSIVDSKVGEALGKLYVEREFTPDSNRRMEEMIADLREVFTEKLKNLTWMSQETREKALLKFSRFRAKVGYPSKFVDYSSVEIKPDDLFGNVLRSNAFEFRRQISRVNKPVDRELWDMTPPTVNAYFSPTENEIVFPAGILQPPFFDPEMDDAVNYGATGGTIAHEITHGFDDQGRQYDADGNLNDWWSPKDAEEFSKRAKTVSDLYSSLEVLPGLHVNGELTLGENIADLGGISIAYDALERRLSRDPSLRKEIDGLTPEQRLYIGWCQGWRSAIREEALRWQVANDVHSPEELRGEYPAKVHDKFSLHFRNVSGEDNVQKKTITIW